MMPKNFVFIGGIVCFAEGRWYNSEETSHRLGLETNLLIALLEGRDKSSKENEEIIWLTITK